MADAPCEICGGRDCDCMSVFSQPAAPAPRAEPHHPQCALQIDSARRCDCWHGSTQPREDADADLLDNLAAAANDGNNPTLRISPQGIATLRRSASRLRSEGRP